MPRCDFPARGVALGGGSDGAGGSVPLCVVHPLPYSTDPAVYFERVHRAPGAVLLDSGRPVAERGRFDILSAWPVETLAPSSDENGRAFLARLRRSVHGLGDARFEEGFELPFAGGLLGYLAYDFGRRLEAASGAAGAEDVHRTVDALRFPDRSDGTRRSRVTSGEGPPGYSPPADDPQFPDARFGLYDWALITDHVRQRCQLVFHPSCPEARRREVMAVFELPAAAPYAESSHFKAGAAAENFALLSDFRADTERDAYRQAIARIHQYIQAGDCYQVNYTQRFQAPYRGDPWQAYCALRRACPTPFAGYLDLGGDNAILSLSPERFLRLSNRQIEARPIKGTRPRGATPDEDQRQAQALQSSEKDRAENLMIVDLLRNDIGRSSRVGSVRVPELFSLESYPNVHHLVSSITAELTEGLDAFDLLAGSFPGGSITGAPKIRAMQIIDELEPKRRNLYCGSLLYIDVRGEMDSSITIRSLLAEGGRILCWGGGGIVMDSDWKAEYQESLDKVGVLLKTLEHVMAVK